MRSVCLMVLISSLLSGCALYDGLHNQQNEAPATPSAQGQTVKAPGNIGPPAATNQNNPTTNAAKMVAPLT